MKLSVVIPTYNRAGQLAQTLEGLRRQSLPPEDYEVIVVDNGSAAPVRLPDWGGRPALSRIRTEVNRERCAARNSGAAAARGDIVLILDDDMEVGPGFLEAHCAAHREWPGALVVGRVVLPPGRLSEPFVRFRQRLEQTGEPAARGLTGLRNWCTGQNMSIRRDRYWQLGGFDHSLVGIEDQDFAMRHTAAGGAIAFLPEAVGVHHDHALDLRGYCRRQEWASECTVLFRLRYPDWPDSAERDRVSGPRRRGEPLGLALKKLAKAALLLPPVPALLLGGAAAWERLAPRSRALPFWYRLLLGLHLFRGYRRGLRRYTAADVRPRPALVFPQAGVCP